MNTQKIEIVINQLERVHRDMNDCVNRFILKDVIDQLQEQVKLFSIPDVVGSAYFAAKGMNEVIVLAENIADAMDKLEESKKDYKLITAKSYEVIK